MLKVSSVLTDTPSQSLLPLNDLNDSSVNDAVINVTPFLNYTFFQMVNIMDLAAVDSLLQNAPDRVNSFIILFVPYPFSTLRTLIKTLSSSGNILFINTA